MKLTAAILLLATFLCGCVKKEVAMEDESQSQRMARWRTEAVADMRKEATNQITGITRIIDCQLNDGETALSKWTGSLIAEHINHVGGIDRTNLFFIFSSNMGRVYCIRDQITEYHREINRIQSGQK